MCFDRSRHKTRLNYEEITENVISSTVLNLLAWLSSKLGNTLPAISCWQYHHICTDQLSNPATDRLRCTSARFQGDSKDNERFWSELHVWWTARFKNYAAVEAAKNTELTAISNAEDGLVQIVVDNFDADISSQNGKLFNTFPCQFPWPSQIQCMHRDDQQVISRLKKAEMSRDIDYN